MGHRHSRQFHTDVGSERKRPHKWHFHHSRSTKADWVRKSGRTSATTCKQVLSTNNLDVRVHRHPIYEDYSFTPADPSLPTTINGRLQLNNCKIIGRGISGVVLFAKGIRLNDDQRAVKVYDKANLSEEGLHLLRSEIEVYLHLYHPYICRLLDVYEDDEYVYLVMDYCEGNDLYTYLLSNPKISEERGREIIHEVLLSVHYLHKHDIVHRDLKPENFVFHNSKPMLIDFGFSKIFSTKRKMKRTCGSLGYIAPEVIQKSYDAKCDIWSVGVISFNLLLGYAPFSGSEREVIEQVKRGSFFLDAERWSRISDVAKDFLLALLKVDSDQRLSAEEALTHDFLKPLNVHNCHVHSFPFREFAEASIFQRIVMSAYAAMASTKGMSEIGDMFLSIDRHDTGSISYEDFRYWCQNLPEQKSYEYFKALDLNNDKVISYNEFLAAGQASRLELTSDFVEKTFSQLDEDLVNHLTYDQLRRLLTSHGLSYLRAEQLIDEVDTKHLGYVDFEEFVEAVRFPNQYTNNTQCWHKTIKSSPGKLTVSA